MIDNLILLVITLTSQQVIHAAAISDELAKALGSVLGYGTVGVIVTKGMEYLSYSKKLKNEDKRDALTRCYDEKTELKEENRKLRQEIDKRDKKIDKLEKENFRYELLNEDVERKPTEKSDQNE